MLLFAYLLQGAGFGLAAAAQPGPFLAYLISQTLAHGWRHTLPAALAPLISDGPIIALMLLVLTRLPDSFQVVLHLAGGTFILYLAWGAYRNWRQAAADPADGSASLDGRGRGAPRSVLHAALMNMLGPGPYLFWSLVTGPVLIQGWRSGPSNAFAFLAGFYGVMVSCLAGIIVVTGTAQHLGPRVNRALLGASALALAVFGCIQLWRGLILLDLWGQTPV
ncbi:MAG: LysE family translocator [Anaerolineae bacterium]